MNEQGILQVASKLDIQFSYQADDWLMFHCPLAPYKFEHKKGTDSKPGFGVHIAEDDVSYCHCFTCGHKGTLGGLAMLLGKFREEPELITLGKEIDHDEILGGTVLLEWKEDRFAAQGKKADRNKTFPSEQIFEQRYQSVLASPRALRFLARRGIRATTGFALGLRYDPKQKRILFPVYDYWTGKYGGCSGRSVLSANQLDELEQRTGRPQPKVRDYHGLEKDKLLLSGRRSICSARRKGRLQHQLNNAGTDGPQYLAGVEGLFAFAHFVQRGLGPSTFAILGSELLPGKAAILADIGLPIFWFTDNDGAGRKCLYGKMDEETGKYRGGGALDMMFHNVAQFVPEYPDHTDDPDDLTREEIHQMIEEAELYSPA